MLAKKLKDKHIILASGSPRRQLFFKELGLDYEIKLKEVDEIYPQHLKGSEITNYLAELKAKPFLEALKKEDLLITSDTIVWLENKAIGKPKDLKEAKQMLSNLSGKTHQVISSVCITTKDKQILINDTTLVKMKKLTEEEIDFYIHNFNPLDKAGSYGIQEWFGYIAIEKIEGSYFNVMGFPTHKFYEEIIKM